MSDIITVKDNECFIDSEALGIMADVERRSITRLITNHSKELEEFGVMRFEITKPNELGGRPKTIYLLNEQQATLLTTFMKNSDIVKQFKVKLVREFFKMREYINSKAITRAVSKETRKTLTDAIDESGENERMHGRGYSNFTRLVYQLTGLTEVFKGYKHYCKQMNKKPDNFRSDIKPEQLERVELAESLIKPLLKLEKEYSEIKATLEPLFKMKEIG